MFPGWPCLEETPADATSEPKYVMGVALVNGTTADVAQGLAKSIVEAGAGSPLHRRIGKNMSCGQVKYAACAQACRPV